MKDADRLAAYDRLAAGGEASEEMYHTDPVYHALVTRFIPSADEIEMVAARISMSGYSSEAVETFEKWTEGRFGVVGTNSHLRDNGKRDA